MPKFKRFPYAPSRVFLLAVLALAPSAEADTFFVALDGDDSNPGTKALPFATLQRGTDTLRPGDRLFIRGGRYFVEPHPEFTNAAWIVDHRRGNEARPFQVAAYSGERVIVDGSLAPDKTGVLTLNGSSYWRFRGLEFENSYAPTVWAMHGIVLFGASTHNILDRVSVSYMDGVGISITDRSSYVTVVDSVAHHNFDTLTGGGNSDGIQVAGNSPQAAVPTGVRIVRCDAWNNGDDGFDLWQSYRNEIVDSRSWHNGYAPDGDTPAGDGVGFKLGRGRGEHTVAFSVAWDNRYVGFDFNGAQGDLVLYNNTAFANLYNFALRSDRSEEVKNNLSAGARIDELLGDPFPGSFNSWNLRIDDPGWISTDPRHEGFLHLTATSGARDAGTDVGWSGDDTTPDLGAFGAWIGRDVSAFR